MVVDFGHGKKPPRYVLGNETTAAEECYESEQNGMECNWQDYLVSFFDVDVFILREFERG